MEIQNAKKEWITPELTVYGDIISLTKGGEGWKTNGTGDDLVAGLLTSFGPCPGCED